VPKLTNLLRFSPEQAEGSLSTKESRESLDEVILFARRNLFKAFSPPLPNTTLDSDPALPGDWRIRVLKGVRDILIDEEVARRKYVVDEAGSLAGIPSRPEMLTCLWMGSAWCESGRSR
jgi:hypothetical protein